jgi:serine/threonine-protein phosphatase 6 regulatory ankyrin repeat subunit B
LGNESAVEELIALGASVNQAEYDGWTPLHFAAFNNHFAVVESLVNNGAYVSPQTNDGRTPLAMAEKAGNTIIASYLESKTDNEL